MDIEKLRQSIPKEMQELAQWCYYEAEEVDGKHYKRIINPETGRWAKCNDPRTWSTFDSACVQGEKHNGLGVAFALTKKENITCIDLDDVVVDNRAMPLAQDFINAFKDTYIERSMSGGGLHIFCKGNLLPTMGNKNQSNGVEMYDDARFISMTGNSNSVKTLMNKQDKLIVYGAKYIPRPQQAQPHRTNQRNNVTFGDSELLEKIKNSKQCDKFNGLMGGNCPYAKQGGAPDYSSAAFALCRMLSFWTRDSGQIDNIYKQSNLYNLHVDHHGRRKWDTMRGTETYGERTIRNAMHTQTACYGSR